MVNVTHNNKRKRLMPFCKLFIAVLLLVSSQWAAASYRIGVTIARVDDNFMTEPPRV
ncbi:hypothetical protein ALO48_05039, partial [Pseudomonas syringae pv. rhaphiolepidis]